MKKRQRTIIKAVSITTAVSTAASLVAGSMLTAFCLKKKGCLADKFWKSRSVDISTLTPGTSEYIIGKNYLSSMERMKKWYSSAVREDISITSRDGLKLVGHIFPAKNFTHDWVMLVHGYRDTPVNILTYALPYIERGYNIFYLEQRAHGDSEGKYIGMGYPEHFDLLDWIDIIAKRDPKAAIVLHGHSMGAATVLMATGEKTLSNNVICAIADCGFSSILAEFTFNLKQMFHMPAFPALYTANLASRLKTGLNFRKGNVIKYVKNSHTPTFFIHGDCDMFVPTSMVFELYNAAKCEKQLYVAHGAAHVDSQYIDPELYYKQVFSFIDRYRTSSKQ